jgi:N-dimethylarginine dimethylaminohydrolase
VAWFEEHGYRVANIHEPHFWGGEGDVLVADGRVYAGYRFRTEYRALDHVDAILGVESRRLELVDPRFYHLDTCFCPLGDGRALYYPPAFSEESQRLLTEDFETLFAVPDAEALRFACNAVVADGTVVLNTGCEATEAELRRLGFACRPTPTDEFIKAGGSVKCLVLTLDTFETVPADVQEL